MSIDFPTWANIIWLKNNECKLITTITQEEYNYKYEDGTDEHECMRAQLVAEFIGWT